MRIPDNLTIQPPDWPDARELCRDIAKHSESVTLNSKREAHAAEVDVESFTRAMLVIATNAWRIRAKITDPVTRQPKGEIAKDELRKVDRYIESIFESLSGIGMELKDRAGDAFDYGLPEKVIAAQPQAGLNNEIILETIRPTIYWRNQIAQQGEVIIATPLNTSNRKDI